MHNLASSRVSPLMDPTLTIKALHSRAWSLKKRLDSLSVNSKAKTEEPTLISLSDTVSRVCIVISQIQNVSNLKPVMVEVCLGIGEVLCRVHERLIVWEDKQKKAVVRAVTFLVPLDVTNLLKEDEHDLKQYLMLLLFLLAFGDNIRGHTPVAANDNRSFMFPTISNKQIATFWRGHVSQKMTLVPHDTFCKGLKLWFGYALSDATCQKLLYRLDEFSIGRVSLNSLEHLIGSGSVREYVDLCRDLDSASYVVTEASDKPPLLVWVHNGSADNAKDITFAKKRGVQVTEFNAIPLAKAWIEQNQALLRNHDTCQNIRFISDNCGFEETSSKTPRFRGMKSSSPKSRQVLNITAGENLVRYLRGQFYRAPMLVVCEDKISRTRYVTSYPSAGSTRSKTVVRQYISSLADRLRDNEVWRGFDLVPNRTQK